MTGTPVYLNVSLFADNNRWHEVLHEGIDAFLSNNTPLIKRYILFFSDERGKSIQLSIETATDTFDVLAKKTDVFFRKFFDGNRDSAAVPKTSAEKVFMDFPRNSVHYGLFPFPNRQMTAPVEIQTDHLQRSSLVISSLNKSALTRLLSENHIIALKLIMCIINDVITDRDEIRTVLRMILGTKPVLPSVLEYFDSVREELKSLYTSYEQKEIPPRDQWITELASVYSLTAMNIKACGQDYHKCVAEMMLLNLLQIGIKNAYMSFSLISLLMRVMESSNTLYKN